MYSYNSLAIEGESCSIVVFTGDDKGLDPLWNPCVVLIKGKEGIFIESPKSRVPPLPSSYIRYLVFIWIIIKA